MYTYVSLSIWGSKLDTKIDRYIYIYIQHIYICDIYIYIYIMYIYIYITNTNPSDLVKNWSLLHAPTSNFAFSVNRGHHRKIASCGSGQAMFSFRMGVVQVMKVWLRTAATGKIHRLWPCGNMVI